MIPEFFDRTFEEDLFPTKMMIGIWLNFEVHSFCDGYSQGCSLTMGLPRGPGPHPCFLAQTILKVGLPPLFQTRGPKIIFEAWALPLLKV